MNPISTTNSLGNANVYNFTFLSGNVMFLFLVVNTVKLTHDLCRLLPVVFYCGRMSKIHAKRFLEIDDSINAKLILNFLIWLNFYMYDYFLNINNVT